MQSEVLGGEGSGSRASARAAPAAAVRALDDPALRQKTAETLHPPDHIPSLPTHTNPPSEKAAGKGTVIPYGTLLRNSSMTVLNGKKFSSLTKMKQLLLTLKIHLCIHLIYAN